MMSMIGPVSHQQSNVCTEVFSLLSAEALKPIGGSATTAVVAGATAVVAGASGHLSLREP